MKRKISVFLALVMLFVCIPFSVSAEKIQNGVWDGSVATAFESGNGSKESPYVIVNGAQLALLAQKVNNATSDDAIESDWGGGLYACNGEYYELGADIVLNDTSKENWTNSARKWTPIGTLMTAFAGHFDGKGFEINGLYVDQDETLAGLFSIISDKNIGKASVSNLSVKNSYVRGTNYVGGIVGTAGYCVITNCSFDGEVVGAKNVGGIAGSSYANISECKNYAKVHGESYIGGIVGNANNTGVAWSISQCENLGIVEATNYRAGGIVGFANYDPDQTKSFSLISDCFNVGTVVIGTNFGGGIAGALDAQKQDATVVRNCYNIGVGSEGEKYSPICNAASPYVKFEYCYYLSTDAKLGAYIRNFTGIIVNDVNPDGVFALSEQDMHTSAAYIGFDFDDVWGMADGYPVLRNIHDHKFMSYNPEKDGHTAICECGGKIPQEHTLGDVEIITKPECGVEGEKGKKCSLCGDYCEREPVPALECDLGDFEIITEPTCHSDGERGRKCSLCGEYSDIEVVDAYGCMRGDVNHDGEIDADDYIYLKRIYFGTAKLEDLKHPETAFDRSDVVRDGVIDADDYILLKRVYFGMATLG